MSRKSFIPLLFIIIAAILPGCAGKECFDNQNTLPLASFFGMESKRSVLLEDTRIYGLGAPGDSLLADSISLQEVYLPFRPDSPASSFVFKYGGETAPASDTVTFRYTTQPWFASEQCGVVYYFHIQSISHTHNLIDSVAVPGMLITNANRRNIEIYLHEEEQRQP